MTDGVSRESLLSDSSLLDHKLLMSELRASADEGHGRSRRRLFNISLRGLLHFLNSSHTARYRSSTSLRGISANTG